VWPFEGQKLAYVYFPAEDQLLTKDEARRIAVNVAQTAQVA
jgi:hypothetical protein